MRTSTQAIRQRAFVLMALLLMAASMVSGQHPGISHGSILGVVPAYAAETDTTEGTNKGKNGTVNDLWDTVTADSVGGALDSTTTNLDTVVTTAQNIAKTITSVLTIVSFVSLLFWVAKLALSAGNPRNRTTALTGILFSGIALALFGGAWVVVSFFWNLLT